MAKANKFDLIHFNSLIDITLSFIIHILKSSLFLAISITQGCLGPHLDISSLYPIPSLLKASTPFSGLTNAASKSTEIKMTLVCPKDVDVKSFTQAHILNL